ncbi:MAG: hypothetical protein H7A53_04525 [Akkermansiaceae bacterium]|nr:hypothetical protein [Akkermansiaceae bacterium]
MSDSHQLELTALNGANPLGFLAALGVVATLKGEARLSWRRGASWTPVLHGFEDQDQLCEHLVPKLRGQGIGPEAEALRKEAEKAFGKAKKTLKDKKEEIKKQKLPKEARERAIEREVRPIEQEFEQARAAHLCALKEAVPSPELALGQRPDCTAEEFRQNAETFVRDASQEDRLAVDLLAAFGSDGAMTKERITATPFCFITGSGHQWFLDTARQLMTEVTAERIRLTLFEPWTYQDEKLSMRWDPLDDRRYALMDRDPTAADNKSKTVWMANLLAYRALEFFTSAPARSGLQTTGWTRINKSQCLTWPLWEDALTGSTIRSLLQLRELSEESPNQRLRDRGIKATFRCERIQVGNPPLHKINFSPSRAV